MENKEFTFIDLFCGLGGFRIAFEDKGGNCVFSSDIDKYAQETYLENFGERPFGDITKIESSEIPNHDILCAGFPCQPFSLAGKRLGFEDTRGTLFFDVARIIKDKKPKAIILENVAGLVNHDNGNTLKVIEEQVDLLGYKFYCKLMNAYDYGVPQNRNRWYGIAIRKDLLSDRDQFVFPNPIELKITLNDIIQDCVDEGYNITEIAKYNIEEHVKSFKLNKRYSKDHILIANEIRKSRCNFRCDGISPCLTAKMGTGGNNVPVVVKQNRKFTERECLDIMGYPEWYKIKKNNMQSYKQIGNSVVVPVVKLLANNLVNYLF